jgi:hypothetical protein
MWLMLEKSWLNLQLAFKDDHSSAPDQHPLSLQAQMERAAARGSLVSSEFTFSQFFSPIGCQQAVGRTGYGVFRMPSWGAKNREMKS